MMAFNGRGIAIGPTPTCDEVSFEHFGGTTGLQNEHPGGCGFIGLADYTTYHIRIHASKTHVAYWIYSKEGKLLDSQSTYMPDVLYRQSTISLGVAFDYEESTYTIYDLHYGKF